MRTRWVGKWKLEEMFLMNSIFFFRLHMQNCLRSGLWVRQGLQMPMQDWREEGLLQEVDALIVHRAARTISTSNLIQFHYIVKWNFLFLWANKTRAMLWSLAKLIPKLSFYECIRKYFYGVENSFWKVPRFKDFLTLSATRKSHKIWFDKLAKQNASQYIEHETLHFIQK